MLLLLYFMIISVNCIPTNESNISGIYETNSSTPSPTTPCPKNDFQPYSDATLNKLASESPLFATILSVKEELSVTKAFTNKKVAELTKRFEDSEMNQASLKKKVSELTQQLEDLSLNQNNTNKKVAEFIKQAYITKQIYTPLAKKAELEQLKTEFVQHLKDRNKTQADTPLAKKAELEQLKTEFVQHLKDSNKTQAALTKLVEYLYNRARHQFTLPQNLSTLVGTVHREALSSTSSSGSWVWMSTKWWNQDKTDEDWNGIMKGRRDCYIFSAPIILPLTPHFIGQFSLYGHTKNEMKIGFDCFKIKHNHDLYSYLPWKFDVDIRIQDQGFTEIQRCTFEVTGINITAFSSNLIPINKNWSNKKMPKDIEFVVL